MATKKPAAKAERKAKAPAPAPTQPPVSSAAPAQTQPPEEKPFAQPVPHAMEVPSDTATAVHRVERARALPEIDKGTKAKLVAEGIQSFKDSGGRTMNVVVHGSSLNKQEV